MDYKIYNVETLTRLSQDYHQRAVAKGFWDKRHTEGHYFMLTFGELHEAIEADRLGKWAKLTPEQIERLRSLEGEEFVKEFIRLVKGTVEEEIADTVIRLLDILGYMIEYRILSDEETSTDLGVSSFYIEGVTTLADTLWPILQEACYLCAKYAHRPAILYAIRSLELTCYHMGIDLMAHIDLKIKYNETRPRLHGKKY
ncbi:hypothetical protein [Porphyromonas sp. oral taxon 278]|uniref:hypothetical protein n=1 Tax=Porphyromonas sp. oral taxon 278 TaxID=712437 RepID=UPI0025E23619|nr:hypothetical protein [Porphyromonas sp. oral taxon 278]